MSGKVFTKSMRRMLPHAGTVLVVALMLVAYRAWAEPAGAAIPGIISYQGYLEDAGGVPVDGTKSITFRLFQIDSGGSSFWDENHAGVEVTQGLFNVLLGSQIPFEVDDWAEPPVYLEVEVDGETLAPRQEVGAVPYAAFAMTAERAYALSAPDGDPPEAVYVDDDGIVYIGGTVSVGGDLQVGGDRGIYVSDPQYRATADLENPVVTVRMDDRAYDVCFLVQTDAQQNHQHGPLSMPTDSRWRCAILKTEGRWRLRAETRGFMGVLSQSVSCTARCLDW